jgi:hypothetical protein
MIPKYAELATEALVTQHSEAALTDSEMAAAGMYQE